MMGSTRIVNTKQGGHDRPPCATFHYTIIRQGRKEEISPQEGRNESYPPPSGACSANRDKNIVPAPFGGGHIE